MGRGVVELFEWPGVIRVLSWLAPPAALFAVAGILFSGIFDDAPLIAAAARPIPISGTEKAAERPTSEAELDAALAAAFTPSGDVRTRTVVSRFGVVVGISVRMPETADSLGDFVNLRLTLRPTPHGMKVSRMAVGNYEIPSGLTRRALPLMLDLLPGADGAATLLAGIQSVDVEGRSVGLALDPLPRSEPATPAG